MKISTALEFTAPSVTVGKESLSELSTLLEKVNKMQKTQAVWIEKVAYPNFKDLKLR